MKQATDPKGRLFIFALIVGALFALHACYQHHKASTALDPTGQEFKRVADEAEANLERIRESTRRAREADQK